MKPENHGRNFVFIVLILSGVEEIKKEMKRPMILIGG